MFWGVCFCIVEIFWLFGSCFFSGRVLGGRVRGLGCTGWVLLVFVFSARPGSSSSYHMDWFEQQFQLDPFSRCSLGLHRKINIQRLPNRSVHAWPTQKGRPRQPPTFLFVWNKTTNSFYQKLFLIFQFRNYGIIFCRHKWNVVWHGQDSYLKPGHYWRPHKPWQLRFVACLHRQCRWNIRIQPHIRTTGSDVFKQFQRYPSWIVVRRRQRRRCSRRRARPTQSFPSALLLVVLLLCVNYHPIPTFISHQHWWTPAQLATCPVHLRVSPNRWVSAWSEGS